MSEKNNKNETLKQNDLKNKKSNYAGLGLCIGIAVGIVFFKDTGTGIALSSCLGLCIGVGISKKK